jgi:ABC-type xylose transport system permease subunit
VSNLLPVSRQGQGYDSLAVGYIAKASASENTSTNNVLGESEADLRKYFMYTGMILIVITFALTGYITFFKEENDRNKHQVDMASDIFKTIFGFITGVIAAALNK